MYSRYVHIKVEKTGIQKQSFTNKTEISLIKT